MSDHPQQQGLSWRRVDLHVHSPASKDYTGDTVTPEGFVKRLLELKLEAVAITDHNSAAWIDDLAVAAKKQGLALFPGVEISVTGGKYGIHVIALFDLGTPAKTIESLLAQLKIPAASYGDLEAVSSFGPEEVVSIIQEVGGLAILAHADSSKGVLADMSGQQRNQVMNSPALSAVEVTNVGKTAKFLDGTDQNYHQKLAYYRASDNQNPKSGDGHSVEGAGARFSWFKVDGFSLEALRQAFADPDVRIRCDEESPERPGAEYQRIVSLTATAGFLGAMTFVFHAGLNAMIGGKGVGKSLVVEFLRFALDQPSTIAAVRADMVGKLEKQLGLGGKVTVRVQLETGQQIDIERTYDGATNPIVAKQVIGTKKVAGNVASLFPILAYSQTETLEIARDDRAQLRLIDSFLELAPIESSIATIENDLDRSDGEIAEAQVASDVIAKAEKELATHDELIASVKAALNSSELDVLERLRPKTELLEQLAAAASELEETVDGLEASITDLDLPEIADELAKDADVKAVSTDLSKTAKELSALARSMEAKAASLVGRAEAKMKAWERIVSQEEKAYAKYIAASGGDRPRLLSKKLALEAQRPKLAGAVQAYKGKAQRLPRLREQRAILLGKLDEQRGARHALRNSKYAEITVASGGRLQLGLAKDGTRGDYVAAVKELKKGSRVHDATVESLCAVMEPRELVRAVLAGDDAALVKAGGIPPAAAKALIERLGGNAELGALLALEHGELTQDRPTIRFRKDDSKYYELSQLSVGQKCTALLIIALVDGLRPIVIDQPEDALDITSVFEDVTMQLRARKHARQFIVTTHNPTVAVAADSDQFHVLKATADSAELATSGAIDRPLVRAAVIQHLEGGTTSYRLKTRKYGLTKNT